MVVRPVSVSNRNCDLENDGFLSNLGLSISGKSGKMGSQ